MPTTAAGKVRRAPDANGLSMRRKRLIEIAAAVTLVLVLAAASGVWLYRRKLEVELNDAAMYGDVPRIRRLLARGVNPNAPGIYGDQTPLIWAAMQQRADAGDVLVGAGADVNFRTRDGMTPLMAIVAAAELHPGRSLAAAHPLLAHGANVDVPGPYSLTPRRWATRWQAALKKHPEAIRSNAARFAGQASGFGPDVELGRVPPEQLERDLRGLIDAILAH